MCQIKQTAVQVTHGVSSNSFEVAGRTVGHVRDNLATLWGIPDDAVALVNGDRMHDDYVLQDGDSLDFVREFGEKGVGRYVWTDAQLMDLFQASAEDLDSWERQGCRCIRRQDGSRRWTETSLDEFIRGRSSEGDEHFKETLAQIESLLATVGVPAISDRSGVVVRFEFDGTWNLQFATGTIKEEARLKLTKNTNGFFLYQVMLANPDNPPGVLELEAKAGLKCPITEEGGEKEPDDKIDSEGINYIRKQVKRLKKAIDDTVDPDVQARLSAELEELWDYRDTVLDTSGRSRPIGLRSEVARARMRIHRSLGRTKEAIRAAGMPHFARYLDITVVWEAGGHVYRPSKYTLGS